MFYDVADTDDKERYSMIRGHLQTRAVENVTTTISVNATSPFQTAPTMVLENLVNVSRNVLEINRNY